MKPAKCTNCGGVLAVNENDKASVCSYCNTPFVTEQAIQNYTLNITNNNYNNKNKTVIHNHNKTIVKGRRRHSFLLDLILIPATGGIWLIWMLIRR